MAENIANWCELLQVLEKAEKGIAIVKFEIYDLGCEGEWCKKLR